MNRLTRSLLSSIHFLIATGAFAQVTPPFTVEIRGNVPGCASMGSMQHATIESLPGTEPAISVEAQIIPSVDCRFGVVLNMESLLGGFMISVPCNGAVVSTTVQYAVNASQPALTIVHAALNCGTPVADCEGTVGGSALPGTPCDDGNANTFSDLWSPGCNCLGDADVNVPITVSGTVQGCSGEGHAVGIWADTSPTTVTTVHTNADCEYTYTLSSPMQNVQFEVNTSCDGGTTQQVETGLLQAGNASITINLICTSTVPDCEGVPGGTAIVGSACDDGNPDTFYDVYTPWCDCAGSAAGDCNTWVDWYQAEAAGAPMPFEVEYSVAAAGAQPITYSWYFGDVTNGLPFVLEGTSTESTWSRTFAPLESLAFMVVAVDANGCESSYTNVEAVMPCNGILGSLNLPGQPCTTALGLPGVWSNACDCEPTFPVNDECSGALILDVDAPCGGTNGDFGQATQSLAPIVCEGFASDAANDLWYVFIATDTLSTVEVDGDGDLDLVLEVFDEGACPVLASLTCADANIGGGPESVTFTTVPGASYTYRVYYFTPTPADLTFTTCVSNGVPADCEGNPGGTALPGTPCQIPGTILVGVWSNDCTCIPDADPCEACFDTSFQTTPWQLGMINCSLGGTAPYVYSWTLDNGITVNNAFEPVITFNTPGGYNLCLTVLDVDACTSTYCDSVYVDADGNVSLTDPPSPDCEGTPGGEALPGTPCVTQNGAAGIWSAECECLPSAPGCLACFTFEQVSDGGTLTPFTANLNNCSTSGASSYNFLWTLPSGTSSQQNETIVLPGPGAHDVCLTMTDANGCFSTMCDSIHVDANGVISTDPVILPCEANYWVMQGFGPDSLPIPNELWIWNLSSGGTGNFQFFWNFGDGTSSTEAFPTHDYAQNGPYDLCLTVTDNAGCTDTYCDSISIDDNGLLNGMILETNIHPSELPTHRSEGFTINVRDPLTVDIADRSTNSELNIWPNPTKEFLEIDLTGLNAGVMNIEVFDANGRRVVVERNPGTLGQNRMRLDMHGLPDGMYLLSIGTSTQRITRRFVKTH